MGQTQQKASRPLVDLWPRPTTASQMPSRLGFKSSRSDRGRLTSAAFVLLAKKVIENI